MAKHSTRPLPSSSQTDVFGPIGVQAAVVPVVFSAACRARNSFNCCCAYPAGGSFPLASTSDCKRYSHRLNCLYPCPFSTFLFFQLALNSFCTSNKFELGSFIS